jgi:hypothetical protein
MIAVSHDRHRVGVGVRGRCLTWSLRGMDRTAGVGRYQCGHSHRLARERSEERRPGIECEAGFKRGLAIVTKSVDAG